MIGDKIRELVDKQGVYSNKDIALKIGITEANLYRLFKRDSVETKYLTALCDAFNLPIGYFFEEKYASSMSSEVRSNYGNNLQTKNQVGDVSQKVSNKSESECQKDLERAYERIKDLEARIKDKEDMIALLREKKN